jgi:integrase
MADLSGIAGDIYQFHIWLRGISPMIWRRILVSATTHLAAFHTIIQRAFGWGDCHLHRFHIHGCDYGIWYPGTPGFRDDPTQVSLASFHFRQTELVNEGVSLNTIRKRLGHKNLQITLRYADQSDATADAELRAWRRHKNKNK